MGNKQAMLQILSYLAHLCLLNFHICTYFIVFKYDNGLKNLNGDWRVEIVVEEDEEELVLAMIIASRGGIGTVALKALRKMTGIDSKGEESRNKLESFGSFRKK